jgi:hypothetical protein
MTLLEILLLSFLLIFVTLFIVFIILYLTNNNEIIINNKIGNIQSEVYYSEEPINAIWFQPIFIPTNLYTEFAKDVLYGFEAYDNMINTSEDRLQLGKIYINVYFKGFALNDIIWNNYLKTWNEVKSKLSNKCILFPQHEPERVLHNYGQAYVYQTLFNIFKNDTKYKYIITNMSDLYITKDSPPIIHQGIYSFESLGKSVGLIAFNQTPDSVHLNDQNSERTIVKISPKHSGLGYQIFRVLLAKTTNGVAGSTTIFSRESLNAVNGYTVSGVYCPDDGFMVEQMNNKNYEMYIAESLYVTHKMAHTAENKEFLQWKKDSLAFAVQKGHTVLSEEELLPWALKSEKIFEKMNQNLIITM